MRNLLANAKPVGLLLVLCHQGKVIPVKCLTLSC